MIEIKFKVDSKTGKVNMTSHNKGSGKEPTIHKDVKDVLDAIMKDISSKTYNVFDILDMFKDGASKRVFSPYTPGPDFKRVMFGDSEIYISDDMTMTEVFSFAERMPNLFKSIKDKYTEYMIKELETAMNKHVGA